MPTGNFSSDNRINVDDARPFGVSEYPAQQSFNVDVASVRQRCFVGDPVQESLRIDGSKRSDFHSRQARDEICALYRFK